MEPMKPKQCRNFKKKTTLKLLNYYLRTGVLNEQGVKVENVTIIHVFVVKQKLCQSKACSCLSVNRGFTRF